MSDYIGKPILGTSASKDVGTTSGTVAAGDDSRITGAVQSGGALGTPSSGTLTNCSGYVAAGQMVVIDDKTFSSTATTYTVTIPVGYVHLRFVSMMKTTGSSVDSLFALPNNDSTSSGYRTAKFGTTTFSGTGSLNGAFVGYVNSTGNGPAAAEYSHSDSILYFCSDTTATIKHFITFTAFFANAIEGGGFESAAVQWTAAGAAASITSVVYVLASGGTISTGSRIITYGIK